MNMNSEIFEEEILAEGEDVTLPENSVNTITLLQENGWYILIVALLSYYLWKNKISPFISKRVQLKEDEEETLKAMKDPEFYIARNEARMAAVQRLQSNYDAYAQKLKILEEEKKEKKRQEYILRHSQISTGRRLNEEFNPLVGPGGPTYRVPRRTCCNRFTNNR